MKAAFWCFPKTTAGICWSRLIHKRRNRKVLDELQNKITTIAKHVYMCETHRIWSGEANSNWNF